MYVQQRKKVYKKNQNAILLINICWRVKFYLSTISYFVSS